MLPEAGQYVNIHTHRKSTSDNEWVLQSLRHTQATTGESENAAYSMGIHPWDVHEVDFNEALHQLEQALNHPKVIALGESGLDKYAKAPLPLQQKVFSAQLEIAAQRNIPVIIHAVKVNQELIAIKKDIPPALPLIIHGFTGGAQLATSLVKAGFYLSLGKKLLTSSKMEEMLKAVGMDPVFLETDESDVPIREIYAYASVVLGIDVDTLAMHMVEKVRNIFNH